MLLLFGAFATISAFSGQIGETDDRYVSLRPAYREVADVFDIEFGIIDTVGFEPVKKVARFVERQALRNPHGRQRDPIHLDRHFLHDRLASRSENPPLSLELCQTLNRGEEQSGEIGDGPAKWARFLPSSFI